MGGWRHKCFATLVLMAGTVDCSATLKSADATFDVSDASGDESITLMTKAYVNVDAGALPALDCLDRSPSASPDPTTVDLTVIAFDRSEFNMFVTVDGGVRLLDGYTQQAGVSIQGCAREDTACSSPVTPEVVTDDAGSARLMLPGTFDGFLSLLRADTVPSSYYLGRLPTGEPSVTRYVSPATPRDLKVAAMLISVPGNFDLSRGVLMVAVYDCLDQPIAGATIDLSVDAGFANYLTSPSSDQTGPGGARLFVDVPEGDVTVSSSLKGSGRLLGTTHIRVSHTGFTGADIRLR